MAVSNYVQETGSIRLGLSASTTDVSADVFSCSLSTTFTTVTRPATFASGQTFQVPKDWSRVITVSLDNNPAAGNVAAMVHDLFYLQATPNTQPVLYFDIVLNNSVAVGVYNRRFVGYGYVMSSQLGGDAGAENKEEITIQVVSFTAATS